MYCRQGVKARRTQGFLPGLAEGALVAVAAAEDYAADLGDDAQGVFEDFGGDVVAVGEDGYAGFAIGYGTHFATPVIAPEYFGSDQPRVEAPHPLASSTFAVAIHRDR